MANTCSVVIPPTNDTPAVVRVVIDDVANYYLLCECPTDVAGHRLWDVVVYHAKDRGHEKAIQRYSTLVAQPRRDQPGRGSCSCPAGIYHADKGPCRHILFISAMWGYGFL